MLKIGSKDVGDHSQKDNESNPYIIYTLSEMIRSRFSFLFFMCFDPSLHAQQINKILAQHLLNYLFDW